MNDPPKINITDGVESAEYINRMRAGTRPMPTNKLLWVDVRERLPETSKPYMVSYTYDRGCPALGLAKYLNYENVWRDFRIDIPMDVTHWLDLSELPRREKEQGR